MVRGRLPASSVISTNPNGCPDEPVPGSVRMNPGLSLSRMGRFPVLVDFKMGRCGASSLPIVTKPREPIRQSPEPANFP